MNKEDKIELRSEEFQEVLGSVPPWILRWGITVLAVVVVILLIGSAIVKYPDVISAQITLTGSTPPATLVAHASGKIKELYVKDNQEVKTGEYLAVIDNSANTKDILFLKNYLDSLTGDCGSSLRYARNDTTFHLSPFTLLSALCNNSSPLSTPPCLNTPNINDYCIIRKKRR